MLEDGEIPNNARHGFSNAYTIFVELKWFKCYSLKHRLSPRVQNVHVEFISLCLGKATFCQDLLSVLDAAFAENIVSDSQVISQKQFFCLYL